MGSMDSILTTGRARCRDPFPDSALPVSQCTSCGVAVEAVTNAGSSDGPNGYPQAGEVVHTSDITPAAGIASADRSPQAAAGAHEVRPAAVSGRGGGDAPGRLAAADATAPGYPDATHDPVLVYQAETCESCGRPWFYRIHGALDRAGRIHDETAARLARPESWTEAERRAAWGDR